MRFPFRCAAIILCFLMPASARAWEQASADAAKPRAVDADPRHWSFQPVQRPDIPPVEQSDWPRNRIDRFVLAKLEAAGLEPMPEADRTTLIRRLTFDLTGLPPTPDEIDAFVRDPAPDAYERLVDRLLASPAYGDRWAQHWLDLARFAETDGFEHDKPRPDAWRYRDWVIAALNDDVPYDEFVRLQIAADEVRPGDRAAADAMGFLLCGPDMPDINLIEERRHNFLNDLTGTVSSVFLGLQMGCAQCHDHKADPISQLDFYQLRAFFDPLVEFEQNKTVRLNPGQKNVPPSRLMLRGDFRRAGEEVTPDVPHIANPWDDDLDLAGSDDSTRGHRAALAEWLTRPDHPLTARVIVNRVWQQHFGRGLSHSPSDFGTMGRPPTHPELLDLLATEFASPTANDKPSGFASSRSWSLKRLHRTIVASATYRQASRPTGAGRTDEQNRRAAGLWKRAREIDPANDLFSRMPRRRLEGEAIRDALLAVSGRLSRRRGGPGVRPPLPKELEATLLKGQWPVTPDEVDHRRRSIYLFVRRNLQYPIFDAFDKPDTNASCPRRDQSTTAPQALMLLNAKPSLEAARDFAGLVLREAGDDRIGQIELCYLRALGRTPTGDERRAARQFLTETAARLRTDGRPADELALPAPLPNDIDPFEAAALTDLCLAVFNLNEFIYVD